MSMTHVRADTTLNATLTGGTTPHLWLHTGSPGAAGTANVAQTSVPANIVRKAITFAAPGNHATNDERRCLSSSSVAWSGEEIASGQTITHFSVWSAASAGNPEFMFTVAVSKMTGSDGVTLASGEVECAVGVFVKP